MKTLNMIAKLSLSVEKFVFITNSLKKHHNMYTHTAKVLPIECNRSIDIIASFLQPIEEVSHCLEKGYFLSTSEGVSKYSILTYLNSIKSKIQHLSSIIYEFSLVCLENTHKKEILQNTVSYELDMLIKSCDDLKREIELLLQHFMLENTDTKYIH